MFREFPITESKGIELRFEAFNATNTPIWGLPNENINNTPASLNTGSTTTCIGAFATAQAPCPGAFGTVTSLAQNKIDRELQFGAKFYF